MCILAETTSFVDVTTIFKIRILFNRILLIVIPHSLLVFTLREQKQKKQKNIKENKIEVKETCNF